MAVICGVLTRQFESYYHSPVPLCGLNVLVVQVQMSKHRLEALTDGIYAVAMTLLVIELRVPEPHTIHSQEELIQQVADQIPHFISWLLSFFVLASFWFGNQRVFHHLRSVNGPLVVWSMMQLLFVGLFPFSSSLTGTFTAMLFSQIFYSANLGLIAVVAWMLARYVHRHPGLCAEPMSDSVYRAARLRTVGLIVISVAAVCIAVVLPRWGNLAFVLMFVLVRISRRIERAGSRQAK